MTVGDFKELLNLFDDELTIGFIKKNGPYVEFVEPDISLGSISDFETIFRDPNISDECRFTNRLILGVF